MDDAACAKQKRRVERLMARWIEPLGLGWWRLEFEWHRGPLPAYPDEEPPARGRAVAMDVQADWRYNHATIRVALPETAAMPEDRLEWAFVHELAHLLVNEMREAGGGHEERVASQIASAFIWLREHLTTADDTAASRKAKPGPSARVADDA